MLGPTNIANKRFLVRWRGYDAAEVEAFLRAVADDQQRLIQYLSRTLSGTEVGTEVKEDELLSAALRGPLESDPLLELNRIAAELDEIVKAARQSIGWRRSGVHRMDRASQK
jgi:DivIVA domain-containing protein